MGGYVHRKNLHCYRSKDQRFRNHKLERQRNRCHNQRGLNHSLDQRRSHCRNQRGLNRRLEQRHNHCHIHCRNHGCQFGYRWKPFGISSFQTTKREASCVGCSKLLQRRKMGHKLLLHNQGLHRKMDRMRRYQHIRHCLHIQGQHRKLARSPSCRDGLASRLGHYHIRHRDQHRKMVRMRRYQHIRHCLHNQGQHRKLARSPSCIDGLAIRHGHCRSQDQLRRMARSHLHMGRQFRNRNLGQRRQCHSKRCHNRFREHPSYGSKDRTVQK